MIYSLNENIKLQGVDGLQTSFSTNGNYSFVSTAKLGDTRLISVILDADEENISFIETKSCYSMVLILPRTLHSKPFKDALTSWTILLQFKNLIIQTIMIFNHYHLNVFTYTSEKIRGFQLRNLLIYIKPTCA